MWALDWSPHLTPPCWHREYASGNLCKHSFFLPIAIPPISNQCLPLAEPNQKPEGMGAWGKVHHRDEPSMSVGGLQHFLVSCPFANAQDCDIWLTTLFHIWDLLYLYISVKGPIYPFVTFADELYHQVLIRKKARILSIYNKRDLTKGIYYISKERGQEARLGLEMSNTKKPSLPPGWKTKGRRN